MVTMPRILVVDDEPDIARSLKLGLEKRGFRVDAFCDSQEALENYNPEAYDLLIIDLRMPKLNGVELAKAIRENDPDALVWFLTAFELHSEELEKIFPGVDASALINKPISVNELSKKIETDLRLDNGMFVSVKSTGNFA